MRLINYRPAIVALVGHPKAGKTTAAEILKNLYGYQIVDTGAPLRKISMKYLGLDRDMVYTQKGKASRVMIAGKEWQVRDILGTLGAKLEEMFGEEIMPIMSHNMVGPDSLIVDPSCRKTQGHYWKRQGGVVIKIDNPAVGPSPYAFDKFDESSVDHTILNDGLARELSEADAMADLERKIHRLFSSLGK